MENLLAVDKIIFCFIQIAVVSAVDPGKGKITVTNCNLQLQIDLLPVDSEPAVSSVNASKDVVNYTRFQLLSSRWHYCHKNTFLFATKVTKYKQIVWLLQEHLN